MTVHRRTALIAGILYLVTVVTSFVALALKDPVLTDPDTLLEGGVSALQWASLLELVLAVACVGTAVVLFPIARRQSESAALGFVTARAVEAAAIVVGIIAMLALADAPRSGEASSVGAADTVLIAIHDWAFLVGPGFIPAVNGLCLGYVLYRSGLVPRIIPLLGLIGAPLLAVSAGATMLGALDQVSAPAAALALPIAAWEISLGLWLVTKGFRPEGLHRLGPASGATRREAAPAT